MMQQKQQTTDGFSAELLATVGHEFRGPLTTIQGYALTLLRHEQRLTPLERQEFFHAIHETSLHLGKLVDRFLALAQLEAHTSTLRFAPVNLLALVQEAITAFQDSRLHHILLTPSLEREEAQENGDHDAPGWHEPTLLGDRRLLRTMLDILLENAVAYSAPGSLVEVSLACSDGRSALNEAQASAGPGVHRALIVSSPMQDWERLLVVRVRDHGMGIEPAHLALIFRRFYRVDTSLTREVNGLGLGLTLCQAMVSLHHGMLWVESAVGEGSTFSIALPCDRSPQESEQAGTED